ncbi:hypothetical protein HWV62_8415 [Athelia sp. TMB]|nr:hypothetical protein HWV62_8415 [Athelia sp. TMB]
MVILVESAAIYSTTHLLYAILYLVKSNIEGTPSYLEASVASITCSLIIIRCEAVARGESAASLSFHFGPHLEGWHDTIDSGYTGQENAKISDNTNVNAPFTMEKVV